MNMGGGGGEGGGRGGGRGGGVGNQHFVHAGLDVRHSIYSDIMSCDNPIFTVYDFIYVLPICTYMYITSLCGVNKVLNASMYSQVGVFTPCFPLSVTAVAVLTFLYQCISYGNTIIQYILLIVCVYIIINACMYVIV